MKAATKAQRKHTLSEPVRLRRWGNSYGFGVSKKMLGQLNAGPETRFRAEVETNRLIFHIERDKKAFPTLDEIIASIDSNDPHEYIDWGPPVGKEIW